ncbi:RcnB family protein [Ramlibacter sp. MMS24-I3-19]|uniref:RcnB family protein n=1 Tax=Ramlibacter sp. MMS24-I3-19 TaxID=3416606 RepID=UPI003D03FEAA
MKQASITLAGRAVAAALALTLASGPVLADKGGHGHEKHGRHHDHDDDDHDRDHGHGRREARVGGYFDARDRQAVQVYYVEQGRAGHCPPGLAKKHNGCMPPGQARGYYVGQPLPAQVVYYPVPQPVLMQLPPPPPQHKYVRVAGDILLIAVGTSMVVDAIGDIQR